MSVSFAGVLFIIANSDRGKKSGEVVNGMFFLGVISNIGCVTIATVINVIVRYLKAVH
jgi:hypothetical protein